MPADFSLRDKVIVVTGASRGIGAAIATACAASGATVVLASRKQDGLDETAAAITEAGGAALPIACHVGRPDEVEALFQRTAAELGTVHGLVNNAGTNPYFGPTLATSEAAFDKTFEINVKGYLFAAREFTSQASGGSIVNIASVAGIEASPLMGAYGMTKAAVISMTKTLAVELAPAGIRVNAIAPGLVETRFASALIGNDRIRSSVVSHTPLARHAVPDEIAGAAVYLLSAASSFTTGTTIVVDGGSTVSGSFAGG
ncbi:MAG TPA: glucose 1-dehydrogenase [Gemmatimonadales bacterium]|nr:glucose 1-dehydrogenase [Gemmatimonadales bacterium]